MLTPGAGHEGVGGVHRESNLFGQSRSLHSDLHLNYLLFLLLYGLVLLLEGELCGLYSAVVSHGCSKCVFEINVSVV